MDECNIARIVQSDAACEVLQRCGITQVLQVIKGLLLIEKLFMYMKTYPDV